MAVSPTMSPITLGGVNTETLADPLLDSLLAVTLVVPAPTAVTMPFASTVATELAPVVHVTALPLSVAPAESFSSADACVVWPT